jgi:hypothetical protein
MPAVALDLISTLRVLAVSAAIAAHRLRGAFAWRMSTLLCRFHYLHNFHRSYQATIKSSNISAIKTRTTARNLCPLITLSSSWLTVGGLWCQKDLFQLLFVKCDSQSVKGTGI